MRETLCRCSWYKKPLQFENLALAPSFCWRGQTYLGILILYTIPIHTNTVLLTIYCEIFRTANEFTFAYSCFVVLDWNKTQLFVYVFVTGIWYSRAKENVNRNEKLRLFTWVVINKRAVWIYDWKYTVIRFIPMQPAGIYEWITS